MRSLFLIVLTFLTVPAMAQRPDPATPDGENMNVPKTWKVRLDQGGHGADGHQAAIGADPETADIYFVNMTPGWHITTKPAAIFYHPASTAEGAYRAETVIHLFDPQGRNEAFGLFIGGKDLEGADQTYDYFVIRNSGEFLIKRRTGSETSVIKNWTKHDAIRRFEAGSTSVPNTLAVEVGANDVGFFINGEEVARLPKPEVQTDGIVGLRINHRLNVHVEDLAVTPAGA